MIGEPSLLAYLPPMIEYTHMNMFLASITITFRLSLGDYSLVDAVAYFNKVDEYCFWIVWLITIIVTNIVFLNFVVAEASNSYNEVSEKLEKFV